MNLNKGPKIAKMADWVDKGTTPKHVFNKFQLKTMQKAILNCLQVSNVIANLPTGFGKSLLFQYPASLQKQNEKCILVIVPLKALLWDTIRQAKDLNITAQQIDSNIIKQYYKKDKLPQMLVTTPQKIFATQTTMSFLQSLHAHQKIRLIAIDQCHCMSQWGHDFRPAYLQLAVLKDKLPGVRLLAISATLTPQARQDLAKRMYLFSAHYFQASYHRPNLYYGIVSCKGKDQFAQTVCNYIQNNKLSDEPGIIYCQTIQGSQNLYNELKNRLKVGLFHSKLSQNMRKQTYDRWIDGSIKTIVGTICFGMGINKKDIRYVINIGISKSPQNYYQESGRAGRDGKQAHCIIVSYPSQMNSLQFLISRGKGNNKLKSHQLIRLQQMKQYTDQIVQCRRVVLFKKLGENFSAQNCGKACDVCRRQKNSAKIVKIDYFQKVKKIIQFLQQSKLKITKIQLKNSLLGKAASTSRKGKTRQIIFPQDIKGIFSKQKPTIVQQIIEGMINKNLLCPTTQKNKGGYVIPYFKAATKGNIKNFKQFYINSIQEKVEKQEIKKSDKFARFIQKKGIDNQVNKKNQLTKKTISISQLGQKKSITNQNLIEGQAIKCNLLDYQLFFSDLYGQQQYQAKKQQLKIDKLQLKKQQINTEQQAISDKHQQQSKQNNDLQQQQLQQCILIEGQIEQQPQYIGDLTTIQNPDISNTMTMELTQKQIEKLIQQDLLKSKEKKQLKRSTINSKVDFL